MSARPGDIFNLNAIPDPELRRKLDYLAQIGSGAVLTPYHAGNNGSPAAIRRAAAAANTLEMIRATRLADPAYQAMSVRINDELDRMDERAVDVLQRIEHALIELRIQRERLLEQAYKGGDGRAIAITADGTAAYYVDTREQVDDETFFQIQDELIGGPVIEAFDFHDEQISALEAHRDVILPGMAEGEQLRDDLVTGAISQDEAEQRSHEFLDGMSAALDDAEAAILNTRFEMPRPTSALAVDHALEEAGPVAPPPQLR